MDIFAEGFRDKIFDTETIAALLGRALRDNVDDVRTSVVKSFTAAMAQGAPHCFHATFVLKISQLHFDTRYLTT